METLLKNICRYLIGAYLDSFWRVWWCRVFWTSSERKVMSAVTCLSLLLLCSLVGGTQSNSITILKGEGGSCAVNNCSLQSSVTKAEDKEIKIAVNDSGTYIKIHTTVVKQDPGNHATIVFVLTTEVSVKTWRISSESSGDSLEYSATLLPTNISYSNIKLVISTKSDGKRCVITTAEADFYRIIFQSNRSWLWSLERWTERKLCSNKVKVWLPSSRPRPRLCSSISTRTQTRMGSFWWQLSTLNSVQCAPWSPYRIWATRR